ncbi:MAG: zinc ribbon domain-containing protein [Microbacteriaceae bacterium]|nr:zinc ribbon domain-containing protein [Microbacteriaceae bacterium]MCL2795613.1 zinc ribbon domain-containing protein [Microbacteriaceae bacterium]
MSGIVPFTDNYRDISNPNGFQFEFHCERCGNGYRSAFQRDVVTTGQGLLRSVGSIFGGVLQEVGNAASELTMNRGTNSSAKDRALAKAVEEIRPLFIQCHGCAQWVCREMCWNERAGQCAQCSPLSDQELTRLQSEARTQQLRDKLASTDLTRGVDLTATPGRACDGCGARLAPGAKFCSECGTSVTQATACTSCGTELAPGVHFCAQCGTKVA